MGFFDKLFRKKEAEPPPSPTPAPVPAGSSTPASSAGTIKAWDSYGRLMEVPREEWRKILPDNFKKAWDKPDELANLIVTCLRDGFASETLDGARHLQRIDPQPKRGAELLGVTLLQLKQFDEAEKVFKDALQQHGEDGSILTNLAKAYSGRGEQERAERALWRAMEVDPNQNNGLLWYAAIHRERGGKPAELDAFHRVAAQGGSWRPQLWLAREALQAKETPKALTLYQEALGRVKPVPGDALMQISGDLGNHGLMKEATEICGPLFDAKEHGFQVGNNLIKAYIDLKDTPSARSILEQLYALQRPDWREHLVFWEREIDKQEKGYGPVNDGAKLELQLLTLEGPIWARSNSPFSEMLPAKAEDAVKVVFFCGSVEVPPMAHGDQIVSQPTDALGRFTRGLPMFLAERVHIKTTAATTVLVPWLKSGGFVLAGGPYTFDALASLEQKPDYAVFLHVVAREEPWQAKLSIVRAIDQKTVVDWEQTVDPKDAGAAINALVKRTLRELQAVAQVTLQSSTESLFAPTVTRLPAYVACLEQALAIFCSAHAPDTKPFLYAERSIIDGLLDLCLRETDNVTMRMLLLSTVERESRARPDVAGEYRERLERLQREYPLRTPAQGLTDAALTRIYAEEK